MRSLDWVVVVLYVAWMACAAVYLDHHWIQDVVAGAACSLAVAAGARAITGPIVVAGRSASAAA